MKKCIFVMAAFTLTSCLSPEERAQQEAQKEIAQCAQAGYQEGTPAFDDCRLKVKAEEEQRKADRISAIDNAPLQSGRSNAPGPSGM